MSSFVDKEIIDDFIQEALTLLDEAKEHISDSGCGLEEVNGVFRCLHTLKGASGFLQLEELSRFVHRFEDFIRDKQDVGAGLTDREAGAVLKGFALLEQAVMKADEPQLIRGEKYENFLVSLHDLGIGKAGYKQLDSLVGQLQGVIGDDESILPPDNFLPAIEAVQGLLAKIDKLKKRAVLPVDYKSVAQVLLDGADITDKVKLQLLAFEEVALNGKAALANIDLMDLVGDELYFREHLSNGEKILGWDVIVDVCDETSEVVLDAFKRFWEDGLSKEAEITMAEAVKVEEPAAEKKDQGGKVAQDAAPKEEFLRVRSSDILALAVNSGKLVANRNNLENLFQDITPHLPPRLRRHLKDSYAEIDHSVNGLERRVSALNNKEIKDVLEQMPSVVKQLSQDLGKEIDLTLSGEKIEIPRNLIKALKDPLVHIVRNSCDHGIEMPDEREKAGKPRRGSLVIAAESDDERLILSIKDDGHGLDPDNIRRKAEEKGIITKDEQLSPEECQALIFAPGFSTNEEVSTVSGRGVGMDVVKNAIEPKGGKINLSSTLHVGTTIQLVLPLEGGNKTRDILLVQISEQVFGIDYRCLVEILKVDMVDSHFFKDNGFFNYRNTLIPMVDLAGILSASGGVEEQGRIQEVLVVEDEQKNRICFGVHGIKNKAKVVVNGFQHDFLKSNTLFSGTAVVGVGQPCLVLDFKDVGNFI